MDQEATESTGPTGGTAVYLLIVGGLLLLITALLAGLWLRERRRCNKLQQDMAKLERTLRSGTSVSGQLELQMRRLLGQPRPATRPLQRDDLPAETVTWNGRPRKVLRISAAAGQRLGLRPGDAVVVAEQPATAPGP